MTMSVHVDSRAPTTTFPTHYFGGGLIDRGECYVVERFSAMKWRNTPLARRGVDEEQRSRPAEAPSRLGR